MMRSTLAALAAFLTFTTSVVGAEDFNAFDKVQLGVNKAAAQTGGYHPTSAPTVIEKSVPQGVKPHPNAVWCTPPGLPPGWCSPNAGTSTASTTPDAPRPAPMPQPPVSTGG